MGHAAGVVALIPFPPREPVTTGIQTQHCLFSMMEETDNLLQKVGVYLNDPIETKYHFKDTLIHFFYINS